MENSVITTIGKLEGIVRAMKLNLRKEDMTDTVEIVATQDAGGELIMLIQCHRNDDRASEVFELRN